MKMKRVTYLGKQQSYGTSKYSFTKKKSFIDMPEIEAEAFLGNKDFLIVDSPKYASEGENPKEEEKLPINDSEEVKTDVEEELDGEENEEENEEENGEEKPAKKKKKKAKK